MSFPFIEDEMTETIFCYCCRTHHPKDQMRPFLTKTGYRWRCFRSIEAASAPNVERDAFGLRQTEMNRTQAREMAAHRARHRLQAGL